MRILQNRLDNPPETADDKDAADKNLLTGIINEYVLYLLLCVPRYSYQEAGKCEYTRHCSKLFALSLVLTTNKCS